MCGRAAWRAVTAPIRPALAASVQAGGSGASSRKLARRASSNPRSLSAPGSLLLPFTASESQVSIRPPTRQHDPGTLPGHRPEVGRGSPQPKKRFKVFHSAPFPIWGLNDLEGSWGAFATRMDAISDSLRRYGTLLLGLSGGRKRYAVVCPWGYTSTLVRGLQGRVSAVQYPMLESRPDCSTRHTYRVRGGDAFAWSDS